jgi:citrate lyase subunit beta/citryl-CoA lyase
MRSDIASSLDTASSFLFVPADRPDRLEKALHSGADQVILDLEDGVGEKAKASAREGLGRTNPSRPALLRVNPAMSVHHGADLAAVLSLPWVEGIVLPKVEDVDDVRKCRAVLPRRVALVALVETARGIERVEPIARSGVSRILFGSADFLADIDAAPHRDVLSYPRARLVVASRSAGLPSPVDGPCLATNDAEAVAEEARDARRLGMGGKLCIHPSQIPPVHRVFLPSAVEQTWAEAVSRAAAEAGGGAFRFEGQMVDGPVVARARSILERAGSGGSRSEWATGGQAGSGSRAMANEDKNRKAR